MKRQNKMDIKKIKIHKVLTCNENDSAKDIAKKLRENKERRIFVVDKESKLIGLITTTDLVYKALGENALKARDVMTKDVKAVDISEDLDRALEIMNELNSFVCPVVDKGKILGIISYHELIKYVFKSIEK